VVGFAEPMDAPPLPEFPPAVGVFLELILAAFSLYLSIFDLTLEVAS
jgi:hypothetical protein